MKKKPTKQNKINTIKSFRKKYNLTQKEFAAIIGTSQQGLSGWESGKREVPQIAINFILLYENKISKNEDNNSSATTLKRLIDQVPEPNHAQLITIIKSFIE